MGNLWRLCGIFRNRDCIHILTSTGVGSLGSGYTMERAVATTAGARARTAASERYPLDVARLCVPAHREMRPRRSAHAVLAWPPGQAALVAGSATR